MLRIAGYSYLGCFINCEFLFELFLYLGGIYIKNFYFFVNLFLFCVVFWSFLGNVLFLSKLSIVSVFLL